MHSIIKKCIALAITESENSKIKVCATMLVDLSNSSDIISAGVNTLNGNIQMYYDEKIKISEENIIKICIDTIGQSENDEWFDVRKLRISASEKAHSIKTRTKKLAQN